MKLRLEHGLPFVTLSISYRGSSLELSHVLLDTGSASSIFAVDRLSSIGLLPEPRDILKRIRGVGGVEFVFTKRVKRISLGDWAVEDFEIEVGAMDYGFPIEGLLGVDFLRAAQAVVDLAELEIRPGSD